MEPANAGTLGRNNFINLQTNELLQFPNFDTRPLITLNEKASFLQEAFDNKYILFFEQDPVQECGTLQQTSRGIRQWEVCKLPEI